MYIKNANYRKIKNDLLFGFFEQDISSVLFRNMDNGRWKAYTIFDFHKNSYKVRITEGTEQTVENGFSTVISENTLGALININIRSGEYQRLLLKANAWNGANVSASKESIVK